MGDFTIDLAIRYQIGTARGNRSVLSAMDIEREEFFVRFGQAARAIPNAVPEASMTVQPAFKERVQ